MTRVVLDTNVLVAGILNPQGSPARILEMVAERAVRLATSPSILAEYHDVLSRKKFGLASSTVRTILGNLRRLSTELVPSESLQACTDPTDDKFLECALAAGASCVITGNQRHFPKSFRGIQVLSPSAFLRLMGS